MKDAKNRTVGRYRDVSELRIQFQCEYRFYLKQKIGDKSSFACREGSKLHQDIGMNSIVTQTPHPFLMALIVIVIVAAAILWVLG
ncbi:MAG: hypothetical protein AM326_00535 [Candidatus Thorarchaeota archaeon SMTZ-45]|nr:MAG: hypothetical protein AM326_00535 [Candidatus Thorarchaeota archaeon SMTZ-45]